MDFRRMQGVTTDIVGNRGLGAAPFCCRQADLRLDGRRCEDGYLGRISWILRRDRPQSAEPERCRAGCARPLLSTQANRPWQYHFVESEVLNPPRASDWPRIRFSQSRPVASPLAGSIFLGFLANALRSLLQGCLLVMVWKSSLQIQVGFSGVQQLRSASCCCGLHLSWLEINRSRYFRNHLHARASAYTRSSMH